VWDQWDEGWYGEYEGCGVERLVLEVGEWSEPGVVDGVYKIYIKYWILFGDHLVQGG
jgi:hypothetical protein